MLFKEIDQTEIGVFSKAEHTKKVLVIGLESCTPCEQLSENLKILQEKENYSQLAIYLIKLPNEHDHAREFAKIIDVRFFPSLFYFLNGKFAGKIEGSVPALKNIENWFEKKTNAARLKNS